MARFRVVYSLPDGVSGVDFVEADGMDTAIARVAIQHARFTLVSCTVEGAPPTVEEQRDTLVRALRPLYTVARAILDTPDLGAALTPARRDGLEAMCSDAVAAMRLAGVTS